MIQYLNLTQGGYPKFRFSTNRQFSGDVNPIKYERTEYNYQIEYNNGVIIIMQPGWYTFSAYIRGPHFDNSNSCIGIGIVVDNSRKTYSTRFVNHYDCSRLID